MGKDLPIAFASKTLSPGSRLARWRLKVEEYDYKIIFKPRKINKNASALSRINLKHLRECAHMHSKILANNDLDKTKQEPTEENLTQELEQNPPQELEEEQEIDYPKFIDKFL